MNIMKQYISNNLSWRFVYRNINETKEYVWKCMLQNELSTQIIWSAVKLRWPKNESQLIL